MLELHEELQRAVREKYRLIRELTRGGMSRVFLARDLRLDRDVAIKVLAPELVDPTMVERFHNEVLQTARLQHPTIIPLIEVGAIGDLDRRTPFYVMPYARGESARSRLKNDGTFSVRATVRLLRDVLGALEYAHEQGLVHRDIKPENIYLSGSHAVLADFGIARAISGKQGEQALTAPGEALGTASYMAPEQMSADPATDHRADLYSLGVVGYELLAGRLPWAGATAPERLIAQVKGEKTPLHAVRADVPQELADVIDRLLSLDPALRPQSAAQATQMLEAVPVSRASQISEITPIATRGTAVSDKPSATTRLEAFCDGVFAIAITLLVIELRPPAPESVDSAGALWRALAHLWPLVFAFLLSFLIILITWLNHHAMMSLVRGSNAAFVYANGLLLLGVAFIPFPTALLGEFIRSDHAAPAVVLYTAVSAVLALGWLAATGVALKDGLVRDNRCAATMREYRRNARFAIGLYSALALLGLWLPMVTALATTGSWIFWAMLGLRERGAHATV